MVNEVEPTNDVQPRVFLRPASSRSNLLETGGGRPSNTRRIIKAAICLVIGVIFAYQLIACIGSYSSYQVEVIAEVRDDRSPPAATLCFDIKAITRAYCKFKAIESPEMLEESETEKIVHFLIDCLTLNVSHFAVTGCQVDSTKQHKPDQRPIKPENCFSTHYFWKGQYCLVINSQWKTNEVVRLDGATGSFNIKIGMSSSLSSDYHSTVDVGGLAENSKFNPIEELKNILTITFKRTEVYRLPPPYVSNCFHYTEAKGVPGSLSQESCLVMCLANQQKMTLGCLPIDDVIPQGNFQICNKSFTENIEKGEQKAKHQHHCTRQCRKPCRQDYIEHTIQNEKQGENIELNFLLNQNLKAIYTEMPHFTLFHVFTYLGSYLGLWIGVFLLFDFCCVSTCLVCQICYQYKKERMLRSN